MATYDFTRGTVGYTALKRVPYFVETTVDLAQLNSDTGVTAADVLRMISIPAGTIVLDAGLENMTALTTASCPTFDLETAASTNKWVNASTVVTAATHNGVLTSAAAHGTTETHGGFSTADTIDILINTGTVTVGIIRAWALLLDISAVSDLAGSHKASAYDTAV